MRALVPLPLLREPRRAAPARAGAAASARGELLRLLAERDVELHAHALDVAALTRRLVLALGCDEREAELIGWGGALHDVGKLAMPDALLRKPGPLDGAEALLMRRHAAIGGAIVSAEPALAAIAPVVRASHERWDGTGYPDGLAGEAIPFGARVVAVCDAYSAMRQARRYGPSLSAPRARAELLRCAGTQFDPRLARAFCAMRA